MKDLKKTLIVGGSGLVGKVLINKLRGNAELYSTYNKTKIDLKDCEFYQLDITDAKCVNDIVKEIKPDIVIHSAANRNTVYCEKNPEESYKVNVIGTKNIVNACKSVKAKMAFISSDQVFDGIKGNYKEDDELKPLNNYGKQKVLAEKIIRESLDKWLITRASYIYGWNPGGDNFVVWIIEQLKKGNEVQISNDVFVTPIHVENFADMLIELIDKGKNGIYHVGEGECLTKYDFAKRIGKIFKFDKDLIKSISSESLNDYIPRPRNNCMNLSKIKNELEDFSKYTLENGLKFLKEEYENN